MLTSPYRLRSATRLSFADFEDDGWSDGNETLMCCLGKKKPVLIVAA